MDFIRVATAIVEAAVAGNEDEITRILDGGPLRKNKMDIEITPNVQHIAEMIKSRFNTHLQIMMFLIIEKIEGYEIMLRILKNRLPSFVDIEDPDVKRLYACIATKDNMILENIIDQKPSGRDYVSLIVSIIITGTEDNLRFMASKGCFDTEKPRNIAIYTAGVEEKISSMQYLTSLGSFNRDGIVRELKLYFETKTPVEDTHLQIINMLLESDNNNITSNTV